MLNREISQSETMLDGPLERYLGVGESALASIRRVVGQKEIASILDLPCGHGRVARHLRAAYPTARLFVSDLDEDGAKFCADAFSATKLPSKPNFDDIQFNRTFDLIWVGSLITHLP